MLGSSHTFISGQKPGYQQLVLGSRKSFSTKKFPTSHTVNMSGVRVKERVFLCLYHLDPREKTEEAASFTN